MTHINFVAPEHVVPQIPEVLSLVAQMGFRLPLVHTARGKSLPLENGVTDIHMPDCKH